MDTGEPQPQRVPFVINTEEFIEEIKRVPAIWNYKSEEYNDKVKRLNYWSEIAGKFFEGFTEKSVENKCEITTFLQKKWKNLRDNFTRYLFTVKKCRVNGTRKPRPYAYHRNLSFLLSLTALEFDPKGTALKLGESSASLQTDVDGFTPSKCKETRSNFKLRTDKAKISIFENRKRKKPATNEDVIVEKISKKLHKQLGTAKDEDRLFLLSLNSEFKKISDDHKLDARLEIIQVIKKYKNVSENNTNNANIFVKEEPN